MAEVLFEYRVVGNSVKVTAMDAESLLEVAVIVPKGTSKTVMQSQALQKLNYMLRRKAEGEPRP